MTMFRGTLGGAAAGSWVIFRICAESILRQLIGLKRPLDIFLYLCYNQNILK